MSKAGQEIIKGAKQALEYLKGDKTHGRAQMIIASEIDVKAIRKKTGLNQEDFAQTYGFSLSSLKKWETGVREPVGPTKAYLTVINRHPHIVKKGLHSAY
jgi:putative transcriptional regulator